MSRSIVPIAHLELHENMGFACYSSNPPFGGQRVSGVGRCPFGNLQIPGRTPSGEPGTPAPAQRPAALCEAAETDRRRSAPVGMALRDLGRLALDPVHRQAGNRHCLAQKGLPSVPDVEDPAREARKADGPERYPGTDP